MSQWLNLGQLATRAGRLLPTFTNLTSWLTQPTQDGTTLDNSKGVDAELTDVNCLSFDGINDVVDFNHTLIDGQDFVVEWEGVMGAVSNNDAFWSLFDDSVANAGSYIRYEHTNSRILSRMGLTTIISPSITLAENDVIKLTTTVSNSGTRASAVIVVNGVTTNLFTNQLLNAAPEFDGTGRIGRLTPSSTSIFAGKVTSFKITQGEVNVHFPLSEGSGTKVYDVSGNGNHGTITGATWTTEDGIESWNHEYGFTPAVRSTDFDAALNTGVAIDSSDIVLKCRFLWRGDNQDYLFGAYSATATARFLFYQNSTQMRLITPNGFYDLATTASIQDKFVDLEITSTTATLNGATTSIDLTGVSQAGSLRLFSNNSGTSNSDCDIHSFSLVKDGTLEVDYVASQGGKFYDKVSGSLVSGTGTLSTNNIPALNTKTKQVVTFDGVDDIIYTIQPATSSSVSRDMTVRFKVPASSSNNKPLMTAGTTGKSFGVQVNQSSVSATMGIRDASSGASGLVTLNLPAIGTLAEIRMQWDGALVTGTVTNLEDNTSISGTTTPTLDGTGICNDDSTLIIAGSNQLSGASAKFQGEFLFAGYTEGGVKKFEYDFQNDIGTTTIQDLTANDNDGTVTVGSGGTESFWGQRIADNDGVLVSADYATGNTHISNPAGFVHNNSECGVKLQSRTVGTFDGVADYVDTNFQVALSQSVARDMKVKFITSGTGNMDLFSTGSTSNSHGIKLTSARKFIIGVRGDSLSCFIEFADGFNPVVNVGDTVEARMQWDGVSTVTATVTNITTGITTTQTKTLSVDGDIATTTSTERLSLSINTNRTISGSSGKFNGKVLSCSYTEDGVKKLEYDFSEAQGNTIYDRSGNDNNGSLTVGSSGLETFWADSYREYSVSDLFSHTNGTNNTWVKESGSNITQIGQYDEDETLTSNEDTRNDRYFG